MLNPGGAFCYDLGAPRRYSAKENSLLHKNSRFQKKKTCFLQETKHIINKKLYDFGDYEFLQNELKKTYKINQLLESIEPSIGYPKTKLGNDLATVSSIIGDSKPFKVFHLNHIGYDTHQWQTHQLNEEKWILKQTKRLKKKLD